MHRARSGGDVNTHTVRFDHLLHMSDDIALFEHADGVDPAVRHAYCTDDNARLLSLVLRVPGAPARLIDQATEFVLSSVAADGTVHNRMNGLGVFDDSSTNEDCWGRALGALGFAAVHHPDIDVRMRCQSAFDRGCMQRSPWSRAMSFASLGGSEILTRWPEHQSAISLVADAITVIGVPGSEPWCWPEPTLRYANATVAEAMIAGGAALGDRKALDRGLAMLSWLLALETRGNHLSLVGTRGRVPGEPGPQFDQQPIEAAAMADACWRAGLVTGDRSWDRGVELAASWFTGNNDTGAILADDSSGGCCDGLHLRGVNGNQGAESTLALWSTVQRNQSLLATR
jgi:hypothetical protein